MIRRSPTNSARQRGTATAWRAAATCLAAATLLLTACTQSGDTGVGPRVAGDEGGADAPVASTTRQLDSASVRAARRTSRVASCTEITRRPSATTTPRPVRSRGARLPALTLPCLGRGPDVALRSVTGGPAVLNVWAQWCGPCRKEAPRFQALYERSGDRLLVFGVDYDDPLPDRALALADDLGLRYPQLADPDKRLRAPFGLLAGIPATVFVDAAGRVVHIAHHVYRSDEELERDVRTHLGVDVP